MQLKWRPCPLTFGLLVGLPLSTSASAQTYTTIDYPGSPNSFLTDISDCGQMAGEYQYGSSFGTQRYGYVYSGGTFTPVIFPGSSWTRAVGINCSGDVVGDYVIGKIAGNGAKDLGFLLQAGVYTTIRFPDSDSTIPAGINTTGDIVGWYLDKVGMHGFLLSDGIYTSIDFPGSAAFTQAWKINDAGEIAGRYIGAADGNYHMFVLSNGSFTAIPDVPGTVETAVLEDGGLNNGGDIVSQYCSAKKCNLFSYPGTVHGFFVSGGAYTTFDPPGSIGTCAFGLNSSDQIVGVYLDSSGVVHGYLRAP